MHFGIDVIAADVKPEMEDWIRGAVANAEPALARLTFAPLPPKGKLSFTTDAREMAKAVGLHPGEHPRAAAAQAAHAGRGQPARRRRCHHRIEHLRIDAHGSAARHGRTRSASASLIRSIPCTCCRWSSSFPGAKTAPATIEAAAEFFTHIGMHALRVRREVPGHLTDRLQEAMWREILHMVNEDVATTGELDESIIYGPGLRWAAMGMNLIYHLAGGETGMRHMLASVRPGAEMALDQARGAGAHRDS